MESPRRRGEVTVVDYGGKGEGPSSPDLGQSSVRG